MNSPIRAARPLGACAAFVLILHPAVAAAGRPPEGPRIVLFAPDRGERAVEADDLHFAFYERIYYQRRAPRPEVPSGRRSEVRDRRRECRCLRLADWSKMKFKSLRQIELWYPPDSREARLRITTRDGRVNEVGASALFGFHDSLAPRFVATVDGAPREFPLAVGDDPEARWPAEGLARILLRPPPPPARRPAGRRR